MDQTETDCEIAQLWADYHDGREPTTRNLLVVRYAPLVKEIASKVAAGMPSSVDRGDLMSEGVIGLMDAIEKFEPDRRIQFQSYAVGRIRGAIIDSLRAADWAPRSVRFRQRETGGGVQTQVPVGHLVELEGMALRDDLPWRGGGDPSADEEIRALLAELICDLPERDAVVITLYYFEGLTLAEVGQVLCVTESRVSQLHSRATRTLRTKFSEKASA